MPGCRKDSFFSFVRSFLVLSESFLSVLISRCSSIHRVASSSKLANREPPLPGEIRDWALGAAGHVFINHAIRNLV